MSQDQITQPSMYCRKCGYALVGLSENRCPECGQVFDPGNRQTFLSHRRSWVIRRWMRRITLVVASAALLAAMGLGTLWGYVYCRYHGDWQTEQEAIAALRAEVVDVTGCSEILLGRGQVAIGRTMPSQSGSNWWMDRLCWPVNHLRERVRSIMVGAGCPADAAFAAFKQVESIHFQGATDDHLIHLKGLIGLKDLGINPASAYLQVTGITDAGVEHLKGLTCLTTLTLGGRGISGTTLRHLQPLAALQNLGLFQTRIGDSDLALLKSFPALTSLQLSGDPITDAGLVHLKALSGLRTLDLRATKITDAGLPYLAGLRNLAFVDVTETHVTKQGAESLQKGLPRVWRVRWSEATPTGLGTSSPRVPPEPAPQSAPTTPTSQPLDRADALPDP